MSWVGSLILEKCTGVWYRLRMLFIAWVGWVVRVWHLLSVASFICCRSRREFSRCRAWYSCFQIIWAFWSQVCLSEIFEEEISSILHWDCVLIIWICELRFKMFSVFDVFLTCLMRWPSFLSEMWRSVLLDVYLWLKLRLRDILLGIILIAEVIIESWILCQVVSMLSAVLVFRGVLWELSWWVIESENSSHNSGVTSL
jgi:hypothetical protein